jgi:hypothetical protein
MKRALNALCKVKVPKKGLGSLVLAVNTLEPVFLNIYGAQESIPRMNSANLVAWRAGTVTLFLLGF